MKPFHLQRLKLVIDEMINLPVATPFVDDRDIPNNYFNIIKKPMFLVTVQQKILSEEFKADVELIWNNAKEYNADGSIISVMAEESKWWFNKKMRHIYQSPEEEWINKARTDVLNLLEVLKHPPSQIDPNGNFSAPYLRKKSKKISKLESSQ